MHIRTGVIFLDLILKNTNIISLTAGTQKYAPPGSF
jgi:hypothetical protein